jgi:hypothetical protein
MPALPPFVAGRKLVTKQKVGPASSELNGHVEGKRAMSALRGVTGLV